MLLLLLMFTFANNADSPCRFGEPVPPPSVDLAAMYGLAKSGDWSTVMVMLGAASDEDRGWAVRYDDHALEHKKKFLPLFSTHHASSPHSHSLRESTHGAQLRATDTREDLHNEHQVPSESDSYSFALFESRHQVFIFTHSLALLRCCYQVFTRTHSVALFRTCHQVHQPHWVRIRAASPGGVVGSPRGRCRTSQARGESPN